MATPFNGDSFILAEFGRLAAEHNVCTIVETGTNSGDTTVALAQLAANVHTIELAAGHCETARGNLRCLSNVILHHGSSPEVLDQILPNLHRPVLFYLDAHWNEYWPLLDELRAIARHRLDDSLIVIHDFLVPGKDFGYDRYHGQALCLEYVEPALEAVYGKAGFTYYYNQEVAGARRGVIYVLPKPVAEDRDHRPLPGLSS